MDDQTSFIEKPAEPPKVAATQTTSIETTVVETGPPKPHETMLAGASGRFWIALVLAFGLVIATWGLIVAVVMGKFPTEPTAITVISSVFTAFLGAATGIVGMYFGQLTKPKTQSQ